jgi:SAM-dependent methyltransferase
MPGVKAILRPIFHLFPAAVRELLQYPHARIKSALDQPLKQQLFGDKADLVPPLYLMRDGNRDYRDFKNGGINNRNTSVLDLLTSAGLKPDHRVLDVGCGAGRKTIPLLDFLACGSYEGIDPVRQHIGWCSGKITPRYPNFQFHWVDLWSKYYNPKGSIRPAEFQFPFADGEFDFAILSSVFTHLFTKDMEHYISELGRLLKPGACGFVTFFFLNPESKALIAQGKSSLNLVFDAGDGSMADNSRRLESAVGHDEMSVRAAFERCGISIHTRYGTWCGRTLPEHQAARWSFQDFSEIKRR